MVLTGLMLTLPTGNVKGSEMIFKSESKVKLENKYTFNAYKIFKNFEDRNMKLAKERDDQRVLLQKQQEEIQRQKQLEEEKKKNQITVRISYYTNSYSNCLKTDKITSSGIKAHYGIIAAPKIFSYGTTIKLETGETFVVQDRGDAIKIHDNIVWLDVFIPDVSQEYLNKLGVKYMKANIIK